MPPWPGGPCPACGDEMPEKLIHCRNCRTLLNSDLLWCSFRMVISIPLGLSLSALANPALGAFVAFGLGAFPIEAINRIIRRLVDKTLNQSEAETATR